MMVLGGRLFVLLTYLAFCSAEHLSYTEVLSVLYGRTCTSYMSCSEDSDVNEATENVTGSDVSTETDRKCCIHCSCNEITCTENETCCKKNYERSPQALSQKRKCIELTRNIGFQGTFNNESGQSTDFASLGVIMISSCVNNASTDQRCESPDFEVLAENLPHTEPLSGDIYRNIYCAECNNVNGTVPWLPFVTCSERIIVTSNTMLFPQDSDKIYTAAVTSVDPDCGVYFQPPSDVNHNAQLCLFNVDTCAVETCKDTVPTIEVSAAKMNATFEEDCQEEFHVHSYPDNGFVGLLSTVENNTTSGVSVWTPTDLTPAIFVPPTTQCNIPYVYDPYKKTCRRWYCPDGSQIVGSGCAPVYTSLVKAQINIRLQMTPVPLSKQLFTDYNKTDLVHDVVDRMFGPHVERKVIIIGLKKDNSYLYTFLHLKVDHDVELYQKLYNKNTFDKKVTIPTVSGTLTLAVSLASGIKLEIGTFYLTDIIIIDLNDYTSFKTVFRVDLSEIEDVLRHASISKMSLCSQILLDRSEVRDYVDIIDIRIPDIRLRSGNFVVERTPTGVGYRVCLSDYLSRAEEDLLKTPENTVHSPQAILSVVCNMLSMAGLLVCLVTYFIFDELRSIPGKNNIMLALHLLVAQCLYQFGMDQTEMPKLCIALGVFIHLFWLTAIFWMNACTLHMFRTFVTGQSYRSVRALDPQVCCYMLYCYSVAVTMVAINIGVSLYRSDGQDYGYGGHVCYISDPVMVGWVFALPVGVIIILNMGFFFAVVYQISASTMRRRGKSTDRTNTIIYMKLSSLTGVTWIFGYLYMWTNFAPLEYIFIVLNAGQGVLIFISFICTKRILKLYWNLFRKQTRSCRTSVCMCFRRSPLSEINGVDVNTVKVSLTASSRSKGLPMTGRSSQRDGKRRDKNQKLRRNRSEGHSSRSMNDSSDLFQDSMNIARCLSNQNFEDNGKEKGDIGGYEEMSGLPNGSHLVNGVQETANADIATVCMHQMDINLTNK